MKKFQLFLITALLTAFAGQAWGQGYKDLTAYASVGGKVAASATSTKPNSGSFNESKASVPTTSGTNDYYLFAEPFKSENELGEYEFMAWAEDPVGKYAVSKENPFKVSYRDNDEKKEARSYYAIFRRKDLTKAGYYISNYSNGMFLNGTTTAATNSGSSHIFFDSFLQDWVIGNVPNSSFTFNSGTPKTVDISDIFQIYFTKDGKLNNFYYGRVKSSVSEEYDHAFKFDNRSKLDPADAGNYKDYRKYNCLLYKIDPKDIEDNSKTEITATKVSLNTEESLPADGYYIIAGNGEFTDFSIMGNIQWKQHFYDYEYKTSTTTQDWKKGQADPIDTYPHTLAGIRVKFANDKFNEFTLSTDEAPETITIPREFKVNAQNISLNSGEGAKISTGTALSVICKQPEELTFNIKDCIYKITFAGDNKIQVHIGQYGIATYCSQYNLRIPAGCTVSGARRSIFDNVWRTDPVPTDKVLKAGVPFLLEGQPNSVVTFQIIEDEEYATLGNDEKVESIKDNILKGTTCYEYVTKEDRYLLYNNTKEGVAEFRLNNANHLLGPNKAYIEVGEFEDIPDLEPKGKLMLDLTNNGETGINKHRQSAKSGKMFTPWGTVAGKDYHGVVIMDGKKLFINK